MLPVPVAPVMPTSRCSTSRMARQVRVELGAILRADDALEPLGLGVADVEHALALGPQPRERRIGRRTASARLMPRRTAP